MVECHCGKNGHPLHSVNCPACSEAIIDRVAWAINSAFNEHCEGTFQLRQEEAEELAKAAIKAMRE